MILTVFLVIYFVFVVLGWIRAAYLYHQDRSLYPFWGAIFLPAYMMVAYLLCFIVLIGAGWDAAMDVRRDIL